MKNLKIYKRAIAILTASTLILMSGCSKQTEETKKEKTKTEPCKHITIYFEDEPITFKECEGYQFEETTTGQRSGRLMYTIKKGDKIIIKDGYTNQYNEYGVYHEYADEIIENESVQKAKK